MINVFQPSVGAGELAAVGEIFDSGWVGRGKRTAEFEKAFASHLGVGPANVTSMSCCTEALFMAMTLTGIGPGDDVVLPSVSFVGAGNAVAAHGARPVFCDVDPRTLNPTVSDIEAALTARTKAVMILHYGGLPGDVARIASLCRDRGILLVEDAACSLGSSVDGAPCGTIGDIGAWSFSGPKIVTTGDGGMFAAKDPELVQRAAERAYMGLMQFSGYSQAKTSNRTRWWEFQVSSFSRRSIMNDIQSAIGIVQLDRLEEFLRRRREIVRRYDEDLAGVDGLTLPPPVPDGQVSANYLYWVQMDERIRDDVARDLYDNGVYTTFRYAALHKVDAYDSDVQLPGTDQAVARTLCLPVHQGLDDEDVSRIVAQVADAVTRRTKTLTGGVR